MTGYCHFGSFLFAQVIPPEAPGHNAMEVGRLGLQSVLLLMPTDSAGSLFPLELFSFYLWMSLEDEGKREVSLAKAEAQVSIQCVAK